MSIPIQSNTDRLYILIAEDEKNIADLLVELLSQEDRKIKIVHDGMDAVEELKKRAYDLLITDLMMPRLDGMGLLNQAKKLHPHILVIIITGYASLETAIQAVREGAYDYLRKPFKLEELKISVNNACEKIYLMKENQLLLKHLRDVCTKQKSTDKSSDKKDMITDFLPYYWDMPTNIPMMPMSPKRTLSEIERLAALKQQGLLTQHEFNLLKEKLLKQLT